ncbi:MAG: aspartate--tRNA(Asn) ligase [Clostridia bacterium]|nr:aspartate--tRNA(Asn) ligase [Clostridia bacterium]
MEQIGSNGQNETLETQELKDHAGQQVKIHGMIHKIRDMSGFAFVILRTKRDLVQGVFTKDSSTPDFASLQEGQSVVMQGEVVLNEKVMNGAEIQIQHLEILSRPADALPIVINRKQLDVPLDTNLSYRPISLRNEKERAIFKIQEGIARGFRDYLISQSFTEIRTPKIVFAGAEGGANIFKLDYFGKQVYLAQSPQFYKQTLVGVYERVFEIAPVYRAEKHDTARHLNEYISMDFEMGFIKDHTDIMAMEVGALKHVFSLLNKEYSKELALFNVKTPVFDTIPAIKFMEAKQILEQQYKRKVTDYYDFEPEEEQLICDYAKKKLGCDFIFITHYPSAKRPFYAMDDDNDPGTTKSFDLLYNGLEITTGGQRIHDYKQQVQKMLDRGMNPEDFESYLMIHRYGMPPHGGLGAGLERLTMKLLGFNNVRHAAMFPRDINRVTP